MAEDDENFQELPDLEHEVANGDHLSVLKALAALAAHELAGNRCQKCHMSYMKTGEISSLMLRLQKIFEEIEELEPNRTPNADTNADGKPKRRSLSDIKRDHLRVVGDTDAENPGLPEYGTKNAPRRRRKQGG